MRFKQAERTSQHRTFDLYAGEDKIRFVLDINGRAGCYHPVVNVFLRGPNGSPAGTGPKAFGPILSWLFGARYDDHAPRSTRALTLTLHIPHLTFHRAYKLRKLGALKLYRLNTRIMRRIIVAQKVS